LLLEFNTPPSAPPNPATLVGFTGGVVIFGEASTVCGPICLKEVATGFVGTITPSAVPGPVVGGGLPGALLALGGVLVWRRQAQKTAWAKCTEKNSGGAGPHKYELHSSHEMGRAKTSHRSFTFRIGKTPLHILGGR
jgi:hypothetical protein